MKFIERRIRRNNCDRCERPTETHFFPSCANSPENQKAEDKILKEVRALANDQMKRQQRFPRKGRKKPVQERNDVMGRMFGGKSPGRKCPHQAGPDQGRPPPREPFHLVGLTSPRQGEPQFLEGARRRMNWTVRLFQAVIWRFARDDDVVNVAFPQSRLGDADKLGFFLEFF